MATRSTISIENLSGKIRSIYCHWDGYPEHNGRILKEFYNDEEKVNALIDLGDLSSLDKRISPTEDEDHSFNNLAEGVTVAYHRDRGEELNISEFNSFEEWRKGRNFQEYNYIFRNGKWEMYE